MVACEPVIKLSLRDLLLLLEMADPAWHDDQRRAAAPRQVGDVDAVFRRGEADALCLSHSPAASHCASP